MLIINFTKSEEFVFLVLVTSKHSALGANGHFASLAEVVEPRPMLFANFDPILEYRSITLPISILAWLMVESIDSGCDLLYKSAVDELTNLEVASAVGTLLPLLSQPLSDAVPAAKLGAGGTEHCVLDLSVADKTLEDLLNVGIGTTTLFALLSSPIGVDVLLDNSPCICALNRANVCKSLVILPRLHRDNVVIVVYVI